MKATTPETAFTTPSEREAVLTRVFDAPRDQVFRTILDPSLIPQWWGPRRLSVRVDRMDAYPGGEWRFVLRDSAGRVFTFSGAFKEITPPERVTYSMEFEGIAGHPVVETAELEDLGNGTTRLRFISEFESQADRDAAMRWGVRDGALETADRFAEVLARCAARPGGSEEVGRTGDSRPA